MPRCNHAEATCIISNFWQCRTVGCPNGPEVAARKQVTAVLEPSITLFARAKTYTKREAMVLVVGLKVRLELPLNGEYPYARRWVIKPNGVSLRIHPGWPEFRQVTVLDQRLIASDTALDWDDNLGWFEDEDLPF